MFLNENYTILIQDASVHQFSLDFPIKVKMRNYGDVRFFCPSLQYQKLYKCGYFALCLRVVGWETRDLRIIQKDSYFLFHAKNFSAGFVQSQNSKFTE